MMDVFCKDLSINEINVNILRTPNCFSATIHHTWLKSLIKYKKIDNSHVDCIAPKVQTGEDLTAPWRKIFIQTIEKRKGKVLPLARSKPSISRSESVLSFTQILQYVSHTNYRNLWKECYKNYSTPGDIKHDKDTSSVNLVDNDRLICEIILRMYGCEIIKIGSDPSSHVSDFSEMFSNRSVVKTYQCNPNLLSAVCALESDKYFYIIHETFYQHNLLDALMFSPALLDSNQSRGMFIIFQLVQLFKIMCDRGLHVGNLRLEDIYLNENLWLQVMPIVTNSMALVESSVLTEHGKITSPYLQTSITNRSSNSSNRDREKIVSLETMCNLWMRGRISNLDYLIHLNNLAGRSAGDPRVHPVVPWVTDFSSRCGKIWRDFTKSKYRLTKGDRQLDLTYDALSKEGIIQTHPHQVPHHVSDVLSDITYYVYMARRTPKNILCHFVRNIWVPAEYPVSIQRMQEWTPDECIPEFYTDPTVFKSLHEDLHDLEIPTWATCIEDFIYKHREALESIYVSENLHHWIDLTFGYKLSGAASVKAKNVCLSLVDNHERLGRGGAVQLLNSPHPMRKSRPLPPWGAPSPPRIYRTSKDNKRIQKCNDSSDGLSEDEDTNFPKHLSRLSSHGENRLKSRSGTRTKKTLKKNIEEVDQDNTVDKVFHNSKYLKAQKSEYGKDVIYLPKDYNAIGALTNVENYHLFQSKTFYNQSEFVESENHLNSKPTEVSPTKSEITNDSINSGYRADINSDEHSFTNQMFVKSYEQMYLRKKFTSSSDLSLREWKDRSFNTRVVTDWIHYKEAILKNKKKDMQVLGCLIIEIFLHQQLRPLRSKMNISFENRLACCRLVFQEHYSIFPKFANLTVKLLLDMESSCVTLKGLPMPTSSLLQPLLYNHTIPFPKYFPILYSMITTLSEYSVALDELDILYSFNCDGHHCSKFENLERTKFRMGQKIADGKVYSFSRHLEMFTKQITWNRVESFDLFIPYFMALLDNNDTAILAAWYLFDPISQILGPNDTSKKLLTLILRLYDDDNPMDRSDIYCKSPEMESPTAANCSVYVNRKSIKLYHHIFLLQLIVRFGLKCFLENFVQRLVEAVGGYKDLNVNDFSVHSHSDESVCRNQNSLKKLRCCDESLKVALNGQPDILSPDTSCGSENIITPNVEVTTSNQNDASAESEVFHFENEPTRNELTSSHKDSTFVVDDVSQSIGTSVCISKALDLVESGDGLQITVRSHLNNLILEDISSEHSETDNADLKSPTIAIPSNKRTFTSYIPMDIDSNHFSNMNNTSKTLDFVHSSINHSITEDKLSSNRSIGTQSSINVSYECKISEVSSESLLWLAHRLGPVLTCIYLTRNLLKMLTLCYIGPENLVPIRAQSSSGMESLSIAKSQIVGDANAAKVIECLTSITALYGEQLILMQYLPHVGKLIASCRRRLSAPLEGGLIACLQLLRYLVPCMSDVKLMEQLQDIILKNILHPTVRLLSSTRSTFPSGVVARSALAKKFVDAMYVIALRIGPEMTRRHLCVPALQRFFLAFDKACGKTDNWIKPRPETPLTSKSADVASLESGDETSSAYLEICRDGSTAEWRVVDGNIVGKVPGDSSCSPPPVIDQNELELNALQELREVFHMKLAHRSFIPFSKFVGEEAMERSLKNSNTLKSMCQEYCNKYSPRSNSQLNDKTSPTIKDLDSDCILKKESDQAVETSGVQCQRARHQDADDGSSSNSFGSAPLIGNRIDVPSFDNPRFEYDHAIDVVSCKLEGGEKASRHLKGDWLLYWEHEIGRPDKDNRFNLKQIKLQTFTGHTHSVKSIVVLDNENSFMTGSKDKTVKLWSLRNSGDGSSTSTCQWTYTAHKKGILSLTFLDTLRLAVSTDSNVHIWDPYIESVVSQLENSKNAAISIVRAFPAPSTLVIAATTDNTLKIIDTRTCSFVQDLKVVSLGGVSASAAGSIRSLCCSPNGHWLAVALGGGAICVLDSRTGASLATWRAHDTEPLKICAAGDNTIVSSGLDFVVAAWRPQDGRLQAHLKGASEPVHCLATYGNELITGTTNNRIGVHTAIHQDASFSSTKLRGDVFRGSLTSMAVLPLNRLLLLGGDAGHISLIC